MKPYWFLIQESLSLRDEAAPESGGSAAVPDSSCVNRLCCFFLIRRACRRCSGRLESPAVEPSPSGRVYEDEPCQVAMFPVRMISTVPLQKLKGNSFHDDHDRFSLIPRTRTALSQSPLLSKVYNQFLDRRQYCALDSFGKAPTQQWSIKQRCIFAGMRCVYVVHSILS